MLNLPHGKVHLVVLVHQTNLIVNRINFSSRCSGIFKWQLEILGQKKLTLNNGDEYIRVSGIVRPRDISSDTHQSDRIANADINYIGAGDTARSAKKAGTKMFETITPL